MASLWSWIKGTLLKRNHNLQNLEYHDKWSNHGFNVTICTYGHDRAWKQSELFISELFILLFISLLKLHFQIDFEMQLVI